MNRVIQIFFIIPFAGLGQVKESITIEFSVNKHYYGMNHLNEYLLDTNYNNSLLYETPPTETIKNGNGFNFSVAYQPFRFLDIGIYGSYQYSGIKRYPRLQFVSDPGTGEITTIEGEYKYRVSGIGFGLVSTTYLNQLFHFNEKDNKILKRLIIGIDISGGVGYSKLTHSRFFEGMVAESKPFDLRSIDFQGKLGFKLGFNYLQRPVLCGVGIKLGYQFYKTGVLKNTLGTGPYPGQTVNLDFSGVYGGIYITFGK